MLLNWGSEDDPDPIICAFCNGSGTREEENGVAPAEKGILGLLVSFKTRELLPWKVVMKEPARNILVPDELVVIEETLDCAPETPTKGGWDQEPDFGFQMATEDPGDVNLPPTQTLLSSSSQKMVFISPFGPLEPTAANAPDEGVYDATLFAGKLPIDENSPTK